MLGKTAKVVSKPGRIQKQTNALRWRADMEVSPPLSCFSDKHPPWVSHPRKGAVLKMKRTSLFPDSSTRPTTGERAAVMPSLGGHWAAPATATVFLVRSAKRSSSSLWSSNLGTYFRVCQANDEKSALSYYNFTNSHVLYFIYSGSSPYGIQKWSSLSHRIHL